MRVEVTSKGVRQIVIEDARKGGAPSRTALLAGAGIVLACVGGGGVLFWQFGGAMGRDTRLAGERTSESLDDTPGIALPAPDLLRPLTPEEALEQNAERPLADRPDEPADRFRLSGEAISRLRAVDCLAQAIYYEAASEGVDGGRAVAQVVLNRVRHPAYPASVCGVVYQGSERRTGCQFSFTCDGSLVRIPAAYLWQRSMQIATEALAGRVFAPVGHSTHYHANYVLPYWADSLDKVAVLGRHIFYRLRGSAGASGQFRQRYTGVEPLPPAPPSDILPVAEELAPTTVEPPVTVAEEPKVEEDRIEAIAETKAAPASAAPLAADLARGTLILGEPTASSTAGGKASAQSAAPCRPGGVQKVKPLGAEKLGTGRSAAGC